MGCANSCGPQSSIEPKEIKRNKIKDFKFRRRSQEVIDQITEKVQIISDKLNDQQLTFVVDVLINHPFFVSLNKNELKTICLKMVHAKAKAKQYIFKQGDIGNCFFVIRSGTVDVQIDGKHIRTLSQRETFGQMALLFHCPRTASIKCRQGLCSLLIMKPKLYKQTLYKMKMEENSRNMQTIQNVPLFSCLTNKQKAAISDTIKVVVFSESDVVFRAGDDSQAIYIISQGHLKIEISGKKDITLKTGEIFGEAAIQPNMKRFGSAIATSKLICSMISRKDIQMTLGSSINNLIYYNTKKWVLLRSKTFKNFSQSDINALITQFQPFSVRDQTIIDQKIYKGLIICLEGTINNNQEGKLFNEENLINRSFKCERLVKKGDGQCCFIPFIKVEEIIKGINPKKELKKLNPRRSDNRKQKFNLSDFRLIKKLGQGQFGQVFLVKNIQFGTNLFALKCISKQLIRKQSIRDNVIQQRKILEKSIFPYIVGYVKSFHDEQNIFILMEYIHGKEMFDTIRQVKHMSLEMVKYYFACLMLSIQYLHDNSIVYRDIKPQNSVIDYKGKCYLIDLGTAKQLTAQNCYKTFTIIGTPHYMAPQVFEGKGYSFEADIWSLGCLLYQFVCYTLPFGQNVNDPYQIYKIIKNGSLSFPKFMKDNRSIKLISNLLAKSPKQRGAYTFDQIRKSEFYKDFDWIGLLQQSLKGPYIPKQYEHNLFSALQTAQSQDFLKYFYQSDKQFQIEEWNSNF